MFCSAVLLSFVALAHGLATGDLKVSVKAVSSSVDSVDDIVISAVVTNPTDSDIRVIAKNTILDASATKSFAVSSNGDEVLFSGIRATYDFNAAGIYTTIPAGGSVAVNHTGLGALYDFEAFGTGTFSFDASSLFQTGPDEPIIEAKSSPVDITIKKDVAKRSFIPPERRLSTVSCSNAGRRQVIADSLTFARSLAGGAASDIRTHPNSAEWNTYFGGNSQDDIWWRHDIIAGDLASSGTRIISCTDPAGICGGSGGVIAYTLLVTSGGNIVGSDIYTCDIFFTSVGTTPSICTGGFDSTTSSRGGVILHELSHATAGTSDLGYGCSVTASLSPANKRNNADNYRCMGLAIYKHYNC